MCDDTERRFAYQIFHSFIYLDRGRDHNVNYSGLIDWLSKVQRPTKHIIVLIGDDFYRSYDQTNSVKALKEASWSFR